VRYLFLPGAFLRPVAKVRVRIAAPRVHGFVAEQGNVEAVAARDRGYRAEPDDGDGMWLGLAAFVSCAKLSMEVFSPSDSGRPSFGIPAGGGHSERP
jgi:hypothetical protein